MSERFPNCPNASKAKWEATYTVEVHGALSVTQKCDNCPLSVNVTMNPETGDLTTYTNGECPNV
jgi:hypothetical protein